MRETLLLLLFSPMIVCAQTPDEVLLRFRVVSSASDIGGINVVNLVNEKTAVTDGNGEFILSVKADDLLVLSSLNFEYTRRMIDDEDLQKVVVIIKMTPIVNQLDEVTVNEYSHLSAEAMGLGSADKHHYTPAERKLRTAGDFKPIHLINIIGGGMPLDPLFNAINGKTKGLKKEVEIEKKEFLLEKIRLKYEDNYLTDTLKIAAVDIAGFQYYLINDEAFVKAFDSQDELMANFLMVALAQKYNEILSSEKE